MACGDALATRPATRPATRRKIDMSDTTETAVRADLLYGARKIADYMGITQRQAEHLIETERLPSFKIGKTVATKRSIVDAYLDELQAAPRPPRKPRNQDQAGRKAA
jgi:hypothetical protein